MNSQPGSSIQADQLLDVVQSMNLWRSRLGPTNYISLQEFLEHVTQTVPFYKQLRSSRMHQKALDLDWFPLVRRDIVSDDPEVFKSVAFDLRTCRLKLTSGTTGIPLAIPRDPASAFGFLYDGYRRIFSLIPPVAASLQPGSVSIVLVEDNPDRKPAESIHPSLKYSVIKRVTLGISDCNDKKIVEELRGSRIPILYGRPRAIIRLRELDENSPTANGRITPVAILSSGDNLYSDYRRRIESWFQCSVYDAYVSNEAGFVGVECRFKSGIHVFTDRILLEVLTEEGKLVRTGSGELIITNKENWAMPFVRYQSGDFGIVSNQRCECGHIGPTIKEISGRDSVYFLIGDKRFNPSRFNHLFESLPLKQFSVTQKRDRSLLVKWIPESANTKGTVDTESSIRRRLQEFTGKMNILIEQVETINTPGKKVQRYINELSPLHKEAESEN